MDKIIQVKQLNKTYTTEQGKKVLALDDINLNIYTKDFICIVGPSGCGKSTLLKILAGLDTPSSGSAFFQGVAIARALANNPQVLLMDEPFGALDAYTRILLQKELLRIWEKNRKTIVFVTHSVDEAIYLADTIIVMSSQPGRIRNTMHVDMPRPRDRANARYGQMASEILNMLEAEVGPK